MAERKGARERVDGFYYDWELLPKIVLSLRYGEMESDSHLLRDIFYPLLSLIFHPNFPSLAASFLWEKIGRKFRGMRWRSFRIWRHSILHADDDLCSSNMQIVSPFHGSNASEEKNFCDEDNFW